MEKGDSMKVGLLRCMQTEDSCPGSTCFKVMEIKMFEFDKYDEDITVVGVSSCGGCPGKKSIPRVQEMIKRGADTIVFASCISKGTPNDFICPNFDKMKDAIVKKVGPDIRIIEYTHL